MIKFGWKKKTGENVAKDGEGGKRDLKAFTEDEDEEKPADNKDEFDWLLAHHRRKVMRLEDAKSKAERLKQEGCTLAENERYWESIKRWEEAITLTPHDETLHEMMAQSYTQVGEVYPAVVSARTAVRCNALWWVSHQTLGRAHLGLGEVDMAIKSFSRAIHIRPDLPELWDSDLKWALSLVKQYKSIKDEAVKEEEVVKKHVEIVEVDEDGNVIHVDDGTEKSVDVFIGGQNKKECRKHKADYIRMRSAT